MKWIRSKINKDTIGSITKTLYNKTEWYRKNKFFNSMFFKYTVLFCITAFVAFLPFIRHHKSFIWWFDGQAIQYPAFVYLGKWGRKIIKGFLSGNFNIPLYDFYIGLGEDIPQYLGMWYFEPVSFLSILTPVKYAELMYNFLSVFRLYLAGFSFIYLCKYLQKRNIYVILGAIVYVFTGYVFFFIRHPIFFSSLIYFPFLIVELDKTIKKNRVSIVLALLVALSLFTSYYFLYVNTLLCGIYFLVVVISDRNIKKTFSNIAGMISKIAISYIWGVALSLFTFLPVFSAYLNSNRTGSVINTTNLLIYDYKWLVKLFVFMFTPLRDTGYWLYNGFSIMTLLTFCLLFMKKNNSLLKKFLIISLIMLCFPIFTFIAHGFSTINHRWNYAFALLMGLTIVYGMDNLYLIEKKKLKFAIIPVLIYCSLIFTITQARTIENMATCVFALMSFGVLYYIRVEDVTPRVAKSFIAVVVIANCAFNGYASYAPSMNNYVVEFIDKNTALNNQSSASTNVEIKKEEIFERRAETSFKRDLVSNSLILDYMGISSYSNQQSKGYVNFNKSMENIATDILEVQSLDNRTFLETLSNVKYYTTYAGNEAYIPFGYKYIDSGANGRKIYRNNYSLKFGYMYDSYIDEQYFNKMSVMDKQEALLQSALISDEDDNVKSELKKGSTETSSLEVPYGISSYNNIGIDFDKKEYNVVVPGAKLELVLNAPKYTETYLRLENYNADELGLVELFVTVEGTVKNSISPKYLKDTIIRPAKNPYTNGRYDYLVNLGYHEDSLKKIEITFPIEGKYKIDDIKVYSQPMNKYQEYVKKLNKDYLKDVKWENNLITGKTDTSKSKFMCLSIPYSKGWKAYIDGKEVKIYKTNIMFSGVLIPAGKHNIKLRYFTPGLRYGILLSSIAWIALLIYCSLKFIYKKRKVN